MKGAYYWIPAEVRKNVILKSDGKCHWCSRKAARAGINKRGLPELRDSKGRVFHLDHIESVSNGGKHDETNLVVACQDCNLKKRKRKNANDDVVKKFLADINL